jgi:hypothetical protein
VLPDFLCQLVELHDHDDQRDDAQEQKHQADHQPDDRQGLPAVADAGVPARSKYFLKDEGTCTAMRIMITMLTSGTANSQITHAGN